MLLKELGSVSFIDKMMQRFSVTFLFRRALIAYHDFELFVRVLRYIE